MPDRIPRYSDSQLTFTNGRSAPKGAISAALTRWRLILAAQILDVTAILLAAGIAHGWKPGATEQVTLRYCLGGVAVAAICHFVFYQGRLYAVDALVDEARALKGIVIRWTLVFLVLLGLAGLFHYAGLNSRQWFVIFYVAGIMGLAAERIVLGKVVRNWIAAGYHTLALAVIGSNDLAERLIASLETNAFGIKVTGVFDDEEPDQVTAIRGVPKLGGIADLLDYAKRDAFDTVIIALPLAATERIITVIHQLRMQPLTVRVLPGEIALERVTSLRLGRTELPGVQLIAVADRPISEVALFAKDIIDRLAAAIGLIAIAPVLLFCAVGIALSSPGPIFFWQKRVGYKGREFDILKFRTMHVSERPNTDLTKREDPRVFRFGNLLRKTSFDELPQLFNVLKGDMSLVGPRPHMPEARAAGMLYFDAVNEYASRHRVKPGITGWAQVNGWRGPTETVEQIERRVEHDIYYIENWSLLLDLVILAKTVVVGFVGRNAF